MKLECLYADTCLPDYWGGHHLPHVCVPVSSTTSADQLRKDFLNELLMDAVAGADYQPDNEDWYQAACEAVRELEITSEYPFSQILEDDNEDCYAYFVFLQE